MANEQRIIAVGNNSIVATNHHFSDGYIYGFLSFCDTRTRPVFPLTDEAVSRHLIEITETPTHIEWIGGCIIGFVEALLENSDEVFTSVLAKPEEGQ